MLGYQDGVFKIVQLNIGLFPGIWRFSSGFYPKNGIILVVNPERGDNPSLKFMMYPGSPKTTAFWRGVSEYNSIVLLETTVI